MFILIGVGLQPILINRGFPEVRPIPKIRTSSGGRVAATAKRKPPPSSPRQPSPREEILAEIIVSTNGLDDLDVDMSEDETEVLDRAGPPTGALSRSGVQAPETFLESELPDISNAKEPTSKLPLLKSTSVEPEAFGTVVEGAPTTKGFAAEETPLPSSIEPPAVEEEVEERETQSYVDRALVESPNLEVSLHQNSEDEATTEPAQEESVPAEPDSSNPVEAETNEKQAPQPSIQDDAPQVLSARMAMPAPAAQNTAQADTAVARSLPTETDSDMPDTIPAKAESFEQQAPQPKIEIDVARISPASEFTAPITEIQNLSAVKATLGGFSPAGPESTISQTMMISPVMEDHVKTEDTKEDHQLDGRSVFEDDMEVNLSYKTSTNPGAVGDNTIGLGEQVSATQDSLLEKSRPVQPELRLTSSLAPSFRPCPDQSSPDPGSTSDGISLGDDAARSPAEQSDPMDTELHELAPSGGDMMLDIKDNALALKLRQVNDPSTTPSIENIPSPVPSETQPSSFGLMSTEDVEQAFEDAAEAGTKTADTLLTNVAMAEASTSNNITKAKTTVSSALGTKPGDGSTGTQPHFELAPSPFNPASYATISHQTPTNSTLKQIVGESRTSFASSSSLSALTDLSGLSSKPPSVSSKATTPFDADSPRELLGHSTPSSTFQVRSAAPRLQFNVRPKVSIPADLTPQEYAMECIEAGENSRLNPYALHQEEYSMFRSHISHGQVTTYLNIRNGILRLWVRNPQIAVTREEAIGCAKDTRWFDVANVCFDWLVRRGYINYGCVEIRQSRSQANHTQPQKSKTVVVIGAGFSGLGCARQLEGLFKQYSKRFREMGEEPPRVVVLEGRNRVGGRVYSRAFETLPATAPGVMRGRRFTAEMGGMIITGFERGNPLNILVRGQLGLPYHCLLADMSLHDSNGTNVDLQRDTLVEQLYNACLERVSEYKFKTQPTKLIEGNHDLMDEGRDSSAEGHKTIALVEETAAAQPHAHPVSEQNIAPQVDLVPVSTNRMTGKVHTEPGTAGSTKAAFKAKQIGWTLKAGVSDAKDIDLDPAVNQPDSTLGSVLDNALMQHKDILDLNAQDFRLFNWHIANLEYSNATNLNRLSSRGWDVDVGNEWDGRHTMVVGGYQSVARGLATLPAPLDIQHKAAVKRIEYAHDGSSRQARITLEDGKSVDADYVVNTIPLGVLKHGNVEFQPPLPSWKTHAIERLGFGVLNKVILVYKEAFWDKDRDIFGMLQTPTNRSSLNQKDYASRRGRFFQWFSVTNTTGMPCLLALMAGDAAYDTEITPNDELIAEATEVLRMRYGARVTQPLEAIVTRWESDRFARGSYSNAGVNMQPEDYQLMARTIGNLYFAGEHTIVTHPATVHGAYLSGLRAASDVLDAMLGPIDIPTPLVLPRETSASLKRKAQEEHKDPAQARLEAYEMEITEHIFAAIGAYPLKPAKVAGNPYIIFNKANYEVGRKKCEEGRRAGKGKPSPNEVRTMTSKMWKEASPEVRKPFEDAAEEQKRAFAKALAQWTEAAAIWEKEAAALRERYMKEHPSIPGAEELAGASNEWNGARRAKRIVESYREADSDVDMD
ncbi:hypothetical protein N0V82_000558 [Gnomoniopsis sp. IMI 355080]|nr:hypothetical protein N0V82_000558 [Gnomoniopsis sp. IMI 355080]